MAEPIYIPTNSIQGFPFLHIPDNICSVSLFDDSHSDRCEVMLMVVSFTFPWWLVMLNIFAFVGHLYVFFGKMSSQNLCPILGASQVALVVKNPPTNAEDLTDTEFNPWVRKFPWRGAWNPLRCSCLENPMDSGAWQATIHRAARVGHGWNDLSCVHTQFLIRLFGWVFFYIQVY